MIVIHRYPLEPWDRYVEMPAGAKILAARERGDRIDVWAEVDDRAAMKLRVLEHVMTGGTPPEDSTYVGTCIVDKGRIVVHVYDKGEREP